MSWVLNVILVQLLERISLVEDKLKCCQGYRNVE